MLCDRETKNTTTKACILMLLKIKNLSQKQLNSVENTLLSE